MPIGQAAERGDFFCTVTGNEHVIDAEAFARMKDGAVVANAGHFDVELDLPGLSAQAVGRRQIRPSLEEILMPSGRRVYLLAEGRLVNLAAAEGHPADVMDLSFAHLALAAEHLWRNELPVGVYRVPEAIDTEVARLKLAAMGVQIDTLTDAQRRYLAGWRAGT